MTFGSLFSGVGGFDMGLEAAGWKCAWQVEIDPQAQSVLRYHWPDIPIHADVTDVGRSTLAPVDLICGGFPCQDLSVAGRRAGLAGARSGLFHEFMRVVDELAPRWVLLENVPGLLSSNGGRDMGVVLGTLGELGYGWTYASLDTQHFGPPQRRERVFIVGRAGGYCPPEVLLEPESLPWDPPPSREAREGVAGSLGAGARDSRQDLDSMGAYPLGVPNPAYAVTGGTPIVACRPTGGSHSVEASEEVSPSLKVGTGLGIPSPPAVFRKVQKARDSEDGERWEETESAPTLDAIGHGPRTGTIAFNIYPASGQGADLEASETDKANLDGAYGKTERGTRIVQSYGFDPGQSSNPKTTDQVTEGAAPPLPAGQGAAGRISTAGATIPRRLTPRECERLQGWPDDWTRYGRLEDGTVVELKDSPRYRMCGNGVSAPVAEWIGRRLLEAM